MRKPHRRLALALCAASWTALAGAAGAQTITVVDVVPNSLSGESNRDGEPNVTVNPADPSQIAITAFTPDPMGSNNIPLFISSDGGANWALSTPIATGTPGSCFTAVCDITPRFALNSGALYLAWLNPVSPTELQIAAVTNLFASPAVAALETRPGSGGFFVDQPYVSAMSVLGGLGTGADRVYVADNDLTAGAGKSANVDRSLNPTPPPPAGFASEIIESHATTGQDGPSVRAAVAQDGTVYAAFYSWRTSETDIAIVRDDNWATGSPAFQALQTGGVPGVSAASSIPLFSGSVGSQRAGSQTAIAVDPQNSQRVFVAWGDGAGPSGQYRLHVRSSANGGATWSGDLFTADNATNPALAISTTGAVGFLYQQRSTSGAATFTSHFALSTDGLTSPPTDTVLATVPDQAGSYGGANPIGDYDGLIAIGKDFYGVFSAYNDPSQGTFYPGTTFLRNVDPATHTLRNLSNMPVAGSVDPFFFHVTTVDPSNDFYVRDWSNSPTSHDEGQEPSTNPVFYANSDVWNRREPMAGGFDPVTDRPLHEDPQVTGTNYAFVRVERKALPAPGASPVTVTAQFLYADFGLGSPFVPIAAGPDPTLAFSATDQTQVLASGFAWTLPAVHSTHVCMAVEISAPGDPYSGDLTGHTPGWPTTDLMVLNDNNKAQRNMGVYTGMADGADTLHWALIHNAATFTRDLQLQMVPSAITKRAVARTTLAVVDANGRRSEARMGDDGVFVLPRMAPGEDRWLAISVSLRNAQPGEVVPIDFVERANALTLSGFTLEIHAADPAGAIAAEAPFQAQLLYRTEALRKTLFGQLAPKAARTAPAKGPIHIDELDRVRVVAEANNHGIADPLQTIDLLKSLRSELAAGAPSSRAAALYISALNTLDAYETMLTKRDGDTAKILETVELARALVRRSPALETSPEGSAILDAAQHFIATYQKARGDDNNDGFSAWVRSVAADQLALAKRLNDATLQAGAQAVATAGAAAPARLQGLEHAYLMRLNDLVPSPIQ